MLAAIEPGVRIFNLELVARFQIENANSRFNRGQHVNDATALGPKSRGHGEARMKARDGPLENLLGGLFLQFFVGQIQFVEGKSRCFHSSSSRILGPLGPNAGSFSQFTIFIIMIKIRSSLASTPWATRYAKTLKDGAFPDGFATLGQLSNL